MAIAFIIMILVANIWFIQRMTDGDIPQWTYVVFFLCLLAVFFGFLMMLPSWFNTLKTRDESDENSK